MQSDDAFYYHDINILSLFNAVDFAFFDNTSVMIDYLSFDKPGAYIEIRQDIKARQPPELVGFWGSMLGWTASALWAPVLALCRRELGVRYRPKTR